MPKTLIRHLSPDTIIKNRDITAIKAEYPEKFGPIIQHRHYLVEKRSDMDPYLRNQRRPLQGILLPEGIHIPKSGTLPVFTKDGLNARKPPFGILYIGLVFYTTLPEIGDQMAWLGYDNISDLVNDYTRSKEKRIPGLSLNDKLTLWEITHYGSKPSKELIASSLESTGIEHIIDLP